MRLVQFITETVLLLIVIIELVTLVKVLFMVLVKATVSSSASALTLRYNVGANAYAIIGDTYNWLCC
jgi:hypothetical protein